MNIALMFHNLRERCRRCFLDEMYTWPAYRKEALEELKQKDYPKCFCGGKARLKFTELMSKNSRYGK